MQRLFYKTVRKYRAWLYRHLSTLKPEGKVGRNDAVLFSGNGRVVLGKGNTFGYYPSPMYFSTYCHIEARHEDAVIRIGNNNHFNNGFSIVAEHGNITIGDDCLVGTNVSVIKSDFRPISIANRHRGGQKSKFVEIGNNVFIGSNVSICKGVHVGDNSVIANGSVVFDDVKENTIVRGNPAVFYKEIYE